MKKSVKIILMVVAALVFCGIGFVIGNVVQAMSTLPGNSEDPLATQSYVETVVGERLAVLTTKIEELEAEVAALKGNPPPANAGTPNTDATGTPGTSDSAAKLEITGNGVNFRTKPNTSASKISTLAKGTKVTLLGTEGDWYKIETADGKVGYVSAKLAKKLD